MGKKISEEKALLAIELYSSGKTIAEVGNLLGIGNRTVARILDRYSIPLRDRTRVVFKPHGSKNGRAKLTESDILLLRQLFNSGMTRKELAKRFGVSLRTIYRIVNQQTWKHVDTVTTC